MESSQSECTTGTTAAPAYTESFSAKKVRLAPTVVGKKVYCKYSQKLSGHDTFRSGYATIYSSPVHDRGETSCSEFTTRFFITMRWDHGSVGSEK